VDLFTTATSTDEYGRDSRIAVLPVGSFEQHGDHLPLATDTIVACLIANRIAKAHSLFLLPPVTMSCSHEHEGFPGTVSISAKTLMAVIDDIRASLARAGIRRLVIVNGHGGNYVLSNVVQEANVDGPCVSLFPGRADWETARRYAGLTTTDGEDMHGGEMETSLLMAEHPELVRPTYLTSDYHATERPHLLVVGMRGYTTSGIIGRSSEATPDKGKDLLDSLTESFADHLRVLALQPAPVPGGTLPGLVSVHCDGPRGEVFGVRISGS
jgi:creatinine amidohydrolase